MYVPASEPCWRRWASTLAGIQAAGRVSTCPPGSRNSHNYRLRMLLIAAYSTGRPQK